jgi:arsenite oxidase small subunit
MAKYPRVKIGQINQLKQDQPQMLSYPDKGLNAGAILVKLGERAGGGVGKRGDIVAFSTFCTHQGGTLNGTYNKKYKTLGQCPLHLTTYDLTRYGIVVSGQAYQSLPQITLEVKGNDIYATGVMGLIFGRNDNLIG